MTTSRLCAIAAAAVVCAACGWTGRGAERNQPPAVLKVDLLAGTVSGGRPLGMNERECVKIFGPPESSLKGRSLDGRDDKTLLYPSRGFWLVLVRGKGSAEYRFRAFLACTKDIGIDFGKKSVRFRRFDGEVTPDPNAMTDQAAVTAAFPSARVDLSTTIAQLGTPNPAEWHEANQIWASRPELDVTIYRNAKSGRVIGFAFGPHQE